MKSRSLTFLLAMGCSLIFAAEPQINIPDIVITGDTKLKAELPIQPPTVRRFTETDSLSRFSYDPILQAYRPEHPSVSVTPSPNYLFLSTGTRNWLDLHWCHTQPVSAWQRFKADAYLMHLQKDWAFTENQFAWTPALKSSDFEVSYHDLFVQTSLQKTETRLQKISLTWNNRNIWYLSDFSQFSLELGYLNAKQENAAKTDFNQIDFTGRFAYPVTSHAEAGMRIDHINQKLTSDLRFSLFHWQTIRELGAWFGVGNSHVFPSLILHYEKPVSNRLDVFVSQQPNRHHDDILNQFSGNPWPRLQEKPRQQVSLMDLRSGLIWHHKITTTAFYGIAYDRDYPVYWNTPGTLYETQPVSLWHQTVTLKHETKLAPILVSHEISYLQYHTMNPEANRIPYLPMWEQDLTISMSTGRLLGSLKSSVAYDRLDHTGQRLKDAVTTTAKLTYKLTAVTALQASVGNALDQQYILLRDVPYLPTHFTMGFETRF